MKCEIISVGTELLMGQTENTNAGALARELFPLGIGVYYQTAVGDNEERLRGVFSQALQRSALIILTGGLGPTEDDLTRETVARVLGLPLVKNKEWEKRLKDFFHRFKRPMAVQNLRQTMVPQGGKILPNDRGTAPGIYLDLQAGRGPVVVLLPGPPSEMLPLFREQVLPLLRAKLQEKGDLAILQSKVLRIIGLGESDLSERIAVLLKNQDNPTLAPLAKAGEVHLRITARGSTAEVVQTLLADKARELREILGDYIYGEDEEELELAVARLLWAKGLTLALAESCSGGLLSHRLTNVPGSSDYLLAVLVTYSNAAKMQLLGVEQATLERAGAVSAAVAEQMAAGVRRLCRADIGVGITGIAGPGGGTPEKPVGLTYLALEAENFKFSRRYEYWGGRQVVKERASQTALYLLWLYLRGKLRPKN